MLIQQRPFKSDTSVGQDISSEDVVYYYFGDAGIYSFDDIMVTIGESDSLCQRQRLCYLRRSKRYCKGSVL